MRLEELDRAIRHGGINVWEIGQGNRWADKKPRLIREDIEGIDIRDEYDMCSTGLELWWSM